MAFGAMRAALCCPAFGVHHGVMNGQSRSVLDYPRIASLQSLSMASQKPHVIVADIFVETKETPIIVGRLLPHGPIGAREPLIEDRANGKHLPEMVVNLAALIRKKKGRLIACRNQKAGCHGKAYGQSLCLSSGHHILCGIRDARVVECFFGVCPHRRVLCANWLRQPGAL